MQGGVGANPNPIHETGQVQPIADKTTDKSEMDPVQLSKITRIAEKILKGFEYVAKGAEKVVLRMIGSSQIKDAGATDTKYVFYVPKTTGLISKESSLRAEVAKMKQIKDTLSELGVKDNLNLALDTDVVKGEELKKFGSSKQFAVKVEEAKHNFEKEITNKISTAKEKISFITNFTSGLYNLHRTGYAYGDMKPENCLVYEREDGKKELKISDFGKSEQVTDVDFDPKNEDLPKVEAPKTYKGNLRFAPPEGKLSQKGDVWGAALMMIRTFEEKYLENGKSLVTVSKDEMDKPAIDKRRGVEKFIVEHKDFMGLDEPTVADKLKRRLPRQVKLASLPQEQKGRQTAALEGYIDKLCAHMRTDPEFGEGDAREQTVGLLEGLMKNMVSTDPKDRLSMKAVSQMMTQINKEMSP